MQKHYNYDKILKNEIIKIIDNRSTYILSCGRNLLIIFHAKTFDYL